MAGQHFLYYCLFHRRRTSQRYVVISALDDGDGGYQRQFGVLLEVGDVRHAYVAHGGLDLVQGRFHVITQGTGVGDVGVNAFLKAELGGAAQIVALQFRARLEPSPQYSFMYAPLTITLFVGLSSKRAK